MVIQEDPSLLMYFDNASDSVGSWAFSATHGELVRILDVESVWNHTVYEVWIPRLAKVERVPSRDAGVQLNRQRRRASTASHTPLARPESPTH